MVKPGNDRGGGMMGPPAGILANVQTRCVLDPLIFLIMDESCSAQSEDRRPQVQFQHAVDHR